MVSKRSHNVPKSVHAWDQVQIWVFFFFWAEWFKFGFNRYALKTTYLLALKQKNPPINGMSFGFCIVMGHQYHHRL